MAEWTQPKTTRRLYRNRGGLGTSADCSVLYPLHYRPSDSPGFDKYVWTCIAWFWFHAGEAWQTTFVHLTDEEMQIMEPCEDLEFRDGVLTFKSDPPDRAASATAGKGE